MQVKTLTIVALIVIAPIVLKGQEYSLSEFASVARGAAVRLLPEIRRVPLATLEAGTIVKVIRREGLWVQIQFRDSQFGYRQGYMLANELILTPRAVTAAAPVAPAPHAPAKSAPATSPMLDVEPLKSAWSFEAVVLAAPVASNAPPSVDTVHVLQNAWPLAFAESAARIDPQPAGSPDVNGESVAVIERPTTVLMNEPFSEEDVARSLEGGRTTSTSRGGLLSSAPTTPMPGRTTVASIARAPRVQLFTTLAWIRRLAEDAVQGNRPFAPSDLSEEALEPAIHVVVCVEPAPASKARPHETTQIEQVVLRDRSGRVALQPVLRESIEVPSDKSQAPRTCAQRIRAKFRLDAVDELRGPDGDREIFLTVIDSHGGQASFTITKAQLNEVP